MVKKIFFGLGWCLLFVGLAVLGLAVHMVNERVMNPATQPATQPEQNGINVGILILAAEASIFIGLFLIIVLLPQVLSRRDKES